MFVRAIANYQKIMKYPCICPWIWWIRFNLLVAYNVTLSVSSLSIFFTVHPIPKVTKQLSPWRDNVKMREKSFFFPNLSSSSKSSVFQHISGNVKFIRKKKKVKMRKFGAFLQNFEFSLFLQLWSVKRNL